MLKTSYSAAALLSLALSAGFASTNVSAATGFCDGNCQKEIHLFKLYAKRDSALANMAMGHVNIMGNGVEPNIKKGLRYLRKATKLEFAPAYYQLGYFYYHGMYVEQDFVQAKRWLKKAAKDSVRNAAQLVHNMETVSEDEIRAELATKKQKSKEARERNSSSKVERIAVYTNNSYQDVIASIRYYAGEKDADMRTAGAVPFIFNKN